MREAAEVVAVREVSVVVDVVVREDEGGGAARGGWQAADLGIHT